MVAALPVNLAGRQALSLLSQLTASFRESVAPH
jgi:hypothetical protein